jgi:WD40 repeat protein
MRARFLVLLALSLTTPSFAAAPPGVRHDCHGDPLPPGAIARLGSMRLRHLSLGNVAISHDGSKVATLGYDLRVWDRDTGKLHARFEPNAWRPWAVAFSPDGKSVLSAHGITDECGDVWIWDLTTGERRPLWGDGQVPGPVSVIRFSRDGKTLAVSCNPIGGNPRVYLHDYPSGKARGRIDLDTWSRGIAGMSFDLRGRLVLSSQGVHVFDVARRREIGRLGGKSDVFSFALSKDADIAAIQGPRQKDDNEAVVKLVRMDTGRVVATEAKGPLWSRMAFSADSKELFFAPRDKAPVVAIDAKTGKQTRVVVPAGDRYGSHAAFSDSGRWLARSENRTIRVYDLRTGKESVTFDDHRDGSRVEAVPSPDGKRFATRSNTEVRVWDAGSGKMLRRITGPEFVLGVRWTPDGKRVAVGVPGKFRWYDATTGKVEREVPLPKADWAQQARLSADGKRIVYSDRDREGKYPTWVLDAADGKEVARYHQADELLDFSDDGRRVAFGKREEQSATLQVRTLPSQKVIWEKESHDRLFCRNVRLFASGRLLVWPTAWGWEFETWDVDRNRRCGSPMHVKDLGMLAGEALAVSPDARMLVFAWPGSEGFDFLEVAPTQVQLVEIATGQARATLPLLPNTSTAAFTPDGRRLVTSGGDGTALVWDVDELGARSLTGREWADLAGDARAAFVAICSLVVYPAQAVELLSEKLSPSRIEAKRVRRWLGELGDDSFDVRQAAEKELSALGDHVEEDLRREMARDPAPEARARLAKLLEKLDGSPDGLRRSRAVEVLERVGSDEAAAVLKRLAAGHAGARQTRESADALARLKGRGR